MKVRIKTGDDVIVLSGKNKGEKGRVDKVLRKTGMVVVKGINVVKRHMKPRKAGEKGVIVEITKPVHSSIVSLIDPESGKPTRVKYEIKDKRKVRVGVKSGKEI
jgi:large subunit ribosomal protein L24